MIGGIFDFFFFVACFRILLFFILSFTIIIIYTHSQTVLGVESDIIQKIRKGVICHWWCATVNLQNTHIEDDLVG